MSKMVLNLKFLVSVLFYIHLVIGCNIGSNDTNMREPKKQLVIVIDKSQSVTYNTKVERVRASLNDFFEETYGNIYENIQFSQFIIDGNTSVFPKPIKFHN